ncbi:hypothetical protein HVZ29_16100 [Escherichia coli]|nr:hypothetical protein HVZ29_16100 [Escherichia coli]
MPVLIIPDVNNVDDVEMTRRHGVESWLPYEKHMNNNEIKIGTKNA